MTDNISKKNKKDWENFLSSSEKLHDKDLTANSNKTNISKSLDAPLNLGNDNEISVKDLALMIKKMTNSKSKIIYKYLPKDDPKLRKPDIGNAKKILKWKPKYDLVHGLKLTIDHYKNVLNK